MTTPITFGATQRRRDVAGLTLLESVYRPHLRIGTHAHERPVCVLVLEGSCTTTSPARTLTSGPNALRLVPAGEAHSNSYGPAGARCFLVEITPDLRTQVGDFATLLERPLPRSAAPRAGSVVRRMYQEFALDDDVAPLAVQGCLMDLLATLARAGATRRASTKWLARVREILDAEFRRGITTRELSAQADVHPVHLARAFRARYGCSPSEYVRGLRVEWARRALRDTDIPLSVVAQDAGFADQSHLTREFRRVVGMTPGRLRALARN